MPFHLLNFLHTALDRLPTVPLQAERAFPVAEKHYSAALASKAPTQLSAPDVRMT